MVPQSFQQRAALGIIGGKAAERTLALAQNGVRDIGGDSVFQPLALFGRQDLHVGQFHLGIGDGAKPRPGRMVAGAVG